MNEQRPVETVEEFKLRIAAIIRAKPEQIPGASRPHPALVRHPKRATNRKAKRRGIDSRQRHYERPNQDLFLVQ